MRPSDGKEIERIAWFQCVGSRDKQADADFCSSVCCMFAIKEALLSKEKSDGRVDASIFYMDMRTFGKDFQRYRDRAEKDHGVRFMRNRVHSVELTGNSGTLKVIYADTAGNKLEEGFDLIVLATGQSPPAGTEALAEMTGIDLNPWGFCKTEGFSLSKTGKEGILISGSFSGLRDISESVIQASSASLAASRFIHSKGGGLALQPEDKIPHRDVAREVPHIAVSLCTCNGEVERSAELDRLIDWLKEQDSVTEVHTIGQICTQEGWGQLQEALKKSMPNRVLIASCMPYIFARKLKELGEAIGLNPNLMDVLDIRGPSFYGRDQNKEQVTGEIRALLAMGLGKLEGMDPDPLLTTRIHQKALVIGGGIAGMSSALAIADHGFKVTLVEKDEELGGNLRSLYRTIDGQSPQELLENTLSRVEKHPNIQVYKKTQVIHSHGSVGRFVTTIEKEGGVGEALEHGVTILATGGTEAKTESYAYGKTDAVLTQHELEKRLADGSADPKKINTVAMIQCVDSREEPRNYCSRICCNSALKNALQLKEQNPEIDIYIFYRDIMAYGFLETYYTQARRAGVIFVQYQTDGKPQLTVDNGTLTLSAIDPILGREIMVRPDLLILSTGIVPNNGRSLADLYGVEVNQDGFFQEAESKWRPVDFIKEGLFMAGLAHSPRTITESIAMAEAASQRALRILNSEKLASGGIVAQVRHSLCSLCERCIGACPYGARR
ncbi:MAG: FAD-dependent oxidoreductase, partial [Pseudomonadota bacterium]